MRSSEYTISLSPVNLCKQKVKAMVKLFLVTPVDNEHLISPSKIYYSLQSFSHGKFKDRY